jgi:hypothetical protein
MCSNRLPTGSCNNSDKYRPNLQQRFFLQTHFNIILSFTSRSWYWSLALRFTDNKWDLWVNYMDGYFIFLVYFKWTNPYITYFLMSILPFYHIHKISKTLWGWKSWVPKPQILSLTNFSQEGFNEVLARASVTIHQAIMVIVGYSYIFCVSGHVDYLWTAAQHSYPYLIYIYSRTRNRTLVIRIDLTLSVNIFLP